MDLISRKEAISWIECWLGLHKYYHPYSKCKTMPTSEVIDILEGMPSAEKTGRWVGNGFDPLHCSVCGKGSDGLLGIPWANKSFNYCPNCGAKMEVEHEIN